MSSSWTSASEVGGAPGCSGEPGWDGSGEVGTVCVSPSSGMQVAGVVGGLGTSDSLLKGEPRRGGIISPGSQLALGPILGPKSQAPLSWNISTYSRASPSHCFQHPLPPHLSLPPSGLHIWNPLALRVPQPRLTHLGMSCSSMGWHHSAALRSHPLPLLGVARSPVGVPPPCRPK